MSSRSAIVAWLGLAVLVALHLDFWRAPSDARLFGWMPFELAWRLGWMALAALYLQFFCRRVWIERGDDA